MEYIFTLYGHDDSRTKLVEIAQRLDLDPELVLVVHVPGTAQRLGGKLVPAFVVIEFKVPLGKEPDQIAAELIKLGFVVELRPLNQVPGSSFSGKSTYRNLQQITQAGPARASSTGFQ